MPRTPHRDTLRQDAEVRVMVGVGIIESPCEIIYAAKVTLVALYLRYFITYRALLQ